AVNLSTGLLWSIPLSSAKSNTGTLIYSPAKNTTIKNVSLTFNTCVYDSIVTQMSSNILLQEGKIFYASREKALAVTADGQVLWQCDLTDYEPAKMLLTTNGRQLQLVNFGLATHLKNFVISGIPFILK